MGRPATIRLAPTMQTFLIAWFITLAVFAAILGIAALSRGSIVGAIVAATLVVLLTVVGWRWSGLAVTTTHDQLIVRQFLSTRAIPRDVIASFRVGGRRSETPGVAVWAELSDGTTVVLAATGYYFRTQNDVQTYCARLEEWRQPPPMQAP